MTAEDTRRHWIDQLETVRATIRAAGGKVGFATPASIASMTGLEFLQAILAGEQPYPPIGDTLDFMLVEAEFGKTVFQGTPQLKHVNPLGGVHGGWYATLLDSALALSVHSTLPAGRLQTTAEFSVNIVRAAKPDTGPLRAIGTVVHAGRQLATAEGRIVGPDDRIYAHATTTCLVFDAPAEKRV